MNSIFLTITVVFIITSGLLFIRMRRCKKPLSLSLQDTKVAYSPIKYMQETTVASKSETHIEDLDFKINMIIETGKIGMWDFDIKSNRFSHSDKNCPFLEGITWEQYIEMVYPADRHIPIKNMHDLTTTALNNLQSTYRMQIPTCDEPQWFNTFVFKNKRTPNGNASLFSGILWDITDSIGEKQRLMNSKTILDLTFTAGGITPWEFDLNTNIMSSDNEYSIFYNNKYSIDKYIETFVHPDHREMFIQKIDLMKAHKYDFLDVTALITSKGKYEWTHIIGRVIEDPQTNMLKAVGTSRFITSEVEKQEQLIKLKKEADESNRLKSTFLANMSHEIRTPLSAIVGFSKLIAETADEETREYVDIIETNTSLLMQLINDILDMSRIEAGLLEFTLEPVDICEIFSYLTQVYTLKMPQDVELICEIPDQPVMINADKNRFIQVLSNFLNNAIKYTARGSICLGFSTVNNGFRFYVQDTGKGISKENCAKVFERFSKFDPTVQGTGLGLSICENIIHKLNGRIGVDSQEGKGSEFWFTIPS